MFPPPTLTVLYRHLIHQLCPAALPLLITATDADGTIPSFTTSTLPTGATFVNNGNGTGTFNWTPSFVQSGSYNVTFRASDGFAIDTDRKSTRLNSSHT